MGKFWQWDRSKDIIMEKALTDKNYLLEKYPGKGGWTYVIIPEVEQDKKAPFGWVKVKGTIDNFEIKNYKLMPMGNGRLFLPVKAEIRKKIKKEKGDWIKVVLYEDHDEMEITEELILCLKESDTYQLFMASSEGEKKAFVDWIYEAKTEKTKVDRITRTIYKLQMGLKFADKIN